MLRIADLTSDHADAWADLLSVTFDRPQEAMRRLLDWLQDGFPLVASGAWVGDRLVGQYACVVRRLHLPPNRTIPVGMSVNMAVHPDFRGQGLVRRMAAPVYDRLRAGGVMAGVGFSNAAGVQVDRHSRGYGYQVCGRLESLIAWVTPRRRAPLLDLDADFPTTHTPDLFAADALALVHDRESLLHRYRAHPFRRYPIAIWQENDCLCGVVVYRRVRVMGVPAAALLSAYSVDLSALLARWTNSMAAAGLRLVHLAASPHSRVKRALAQCAPLITAPYTRTPYYLTVKPLTEAIAPLLTDYAAWDCTGGDVL